MTREEAKELLIHVLMTYEPRDQYGDLDDSEPYEEAMTMAIEALSNCSEKPNGSDLISRQDAIDALGEEPDIWNDTEEEWAYRNAWVEHISAIKALPSAEPKTKCIAQIRIDRDDMEDLINEKVNEIVDRMAEPKTGWIPVSERLPDAEYGEGDSVLCCTELGLMYILYWNGGNWCVPTGEPHRWVNHVTGWHDKVIAWMPLPEPYREDGEA